MKILLSVFLGIAVIGCLLFGIAFVSTQSDLSNTKTALSNAQTELTNTQTQLDTTSAKLVQTEMDLTIAEADLNTANENLADKESELASTESTLFLTKMDLQSVTRQRDTAQAENIVFTADYASLRDEINLRAGEAENGEKFITPNDPDVKQQALDTAGSFSSNANEMWSDYKRLYQWVVDNIEYSYDTSIPWMPLNVSGNMEWFGDFWKMPSETMADGRGDCEDMANLLASLMLSYNGEEYGIWCIEIQNDDSGHLAVAVPVIGDQLVILDPAGNYYSGQSYGSIQSSAISVAVNQWLNHWASDMPGARVVSVFSNDFYKKFATTQEFIQWAIDKYAN